MMEWTVAEILKLVFGAMIEIGVGKLTESALDKGKYLWKKIGNKLKGESTAEAALAKLESDKAEADLAEVVPFLQVEMIKDKPFAQELQTLAHEFK